MKKGREGRARRGGRSHTHPPPEKTLFSVGNSPPEKKSALRGYSSAAPRCARRSRAQLVIAQKKADFEI